MQKNITAFGGDQKNVTIAGESAGGGAVLVLLTSPLAQGSLPSGDPGISLYPDSPQAQRRFAVSPSPSRSRSNMPERPESRGRGKAAVGLENPVLSWNKDLRH